MKTLLVSAGGLKRKAIMDTANIEGEELANLERKVSVQGRIHAFACISILLKLVQSDLAVFVFILKVLATIFYPSLFSLTLIYLRSFLKMSSLDHRSKKLKMKRLLPNLIKYANLSTLFQPSNGYRRFFSLRW